MKEFEEIKDIENFLEFVKKEYPNYMYVNYDTHINNVHLYKLVTALEECIEKLK